MHSYEDEESVMNGCLFITYSLVSLVSAFMLDSTEDYCTWILRILGTCFALITLIFIKKKKVLLGVVCLFLAGIYFWRANVLGQEIREREKKYEIAAKIEIEKEKQEKEKQEKEKAVREKTAKRVSLYINNRLKTGAVPYSNSSCKGKESTICVKTSTKSFSDVVVIIKRSNRIVRNAYIQAGDSYAFSIPNGKYQVFFYMGNGWDPQKRMGEGYSGGFVGNESYSKDGTTVSLTHQDITYELIYKPKGNFRTEHSNASEIFPKSNI